MRPVETRLPAPACRAFSRSRFFWWTFCWLWFSLLGFDPRAAGAQAAGPGGEKSPAAAGVQVSALAWLRPERTREDDLKVGGELAGFTGDEVRYIARGDLAAHFKQISAPVKDANFSAPASISGVPLLELRRLLAASPATDMVIAICKDRYHAHYSGQYLEAHDPLLVLKINGRDPADWPLAPGGPAMGPYLISHPQPLPASGDEEAQIPWGVIALEFRSEKAVFAAIAPPGPQAAEAKVQAGYRLAQQNCLRCHFLGAVGGTKSGRSWQVLSAWAASSPTNFAAYIRQPRSLNPKAQMPPSPSYDDDALAALTAYFQTFAARGEP